MLENDYITYCIDCNAYYFERIHAGLIKFNVDEFDKKIKLILFDISEIREHFMLHIKCLYDKIGLMIKNRIKWSELRICKCTEKLCWFSNWNNYTQWSPYNCPQHIFGFDGKTIISLLGLFKLYFEHLNNFFGGDEKTNFCDIGRFFNTNMIISVINGEVKETPFMLREAWVITEE